MNIVAGVSFAELHALFACEVAYFENVHNLAGIVTCLYMLMRVRRLRDDMMHLFASDIDQRTLPAVLPKTWKDAECWRLAAAQDLRTVTGVRQVHVLCGEPKVVLLDKNWATLALEQAGQWCRAPRVPCRIAPLCLVAMGAGVIFSP